MTRPTCAGSDKEKYCERAVVRFRGGKGYCLFHPDAEPPVLDPRTGLPIKTTTVKAVPKDLQPPPYRAPGRIVETDPEPEPEPEPKLADEPPVEAEPAVTPEPEPAAAETDPDGLLELQAELDELERTNPTVAAAAASYDAAVDRVLATPRSPALTVEPTTEVGPDDTTPPEQDADGPAVAVDEAAAAAAEDPHDDVDWCGDIAETAAAEPVSIDLLSLQVAWKVVSSIAGTPTTQPATRHVAREARRALGVLIDQLRHDRTPTAVRTPAPAPAPATIPTPAAEAPAVRKRGPNRNSVPVDAAEAARRYQDGAPLFDLAGELHIGVNRLRTILADHGVTLRKRGEVVGRRGVEPRPFDVDEAQRLYESGIDSAQVARQLGVKQSRVQDALRERGVLRPPLGTPVPLDEARARELYGSGLSLGDVARVLGVRTSRVADVLREHDELRPPGTQTRQPVDV